VVESNTLLGGIYGVALGRVFCAESMFCRPALGGTNASKIALAHLARHLHRQGFALVDVQLRNHHTDQFGVVELPSSAYLASLAALAAEPRPWGAFDPGWSTPRRQSAITDAHAEAQSRRGREDEPRMNTDRRL
jgi:leucyl/phenylalanyl-tRNA--protein transferase